MTIGHFLMYTGANMCSLGYPYGVFKVSPKLSMVCFAYIGIIYIYIYYFLYRIETHHLSQH